MRDKSLIVMIMLLISIQFSYAYIGPGIGLSAIGSFVALVAGLLATIIGFIWYPIKRLFGKKSKEPDQCEDKKE